jgi:NAD(P)H-binding
MKVFVAGATGALGKVLVPDLVARGHEVVGMTRSPSKQDLVRGLGARPVVADALDPDAVARAVAAAEPEVIVHELTALSGKMSIGDARHPDRFEGAIMTNRLRTEATDHLLAAGRAVGARRFVAQSFGAFRFGRTGGLVRTEADPLGPDDPPPSLRPAQAGYLYLEQAVTTIDWGEGLGLRYGGFYGPGTSASLAPDAAMAGPIRKRQFPIIGGGGESTRPEMKGTAAAGLFDEGDTEYAEAFAGARAQLAEMTTADRKAVVFLSDGAPTDAYFDPAVPVDIGGAPIYTIGLGVDGLPEAGSIMARIAANSGGQYYDAQSAGQLQAIFARIVASLTCNSESVTEAFTLAPGASRSIPFEVGAGDGEFRSLASWDIGGVTVSALRPDGSSLTPGTINPGESFINEASYALLTGVNPAIGTWNLIVTANQGNLNEVHVSIDIFKKSLPLPPPPPPAPGRHVDPCIGSYPRPSVTKKILGGHEEIFDRTASLYSVCAGFGAPENLVLTPEMECALIAAGRHLCRQPDRRSDGRSLQHRRHCRRAVRRRLARPHRGPRVRLLQ